MIFQDRAHRIGQRKVVNVYRLITRKSLEEKIMGLQKFKILTANTVVSNENSSMETMGTDQLLDLFSLSDEQKQKSNKTAGNDGVKNVLENLPDLWDNRQYEEEYDMSSFIQSLKKWILIEIFWNFAYIEIWNFVNFEIKTI